MNAKLPAHAIDHQGVECSLYERLWKARGAPLLAAEDGIFLRIPHTVVYRQSAPCGWYFTSKSCQLSRRRRGRLCNDEILSAFGGGSYEPAAIWRQQSRNEKGKLVYEEVVLASVDLEAFLRSEKVTDGVLQKFVRPSGQNMRIFRATWTRHICYIELVEKEAQISDKRTSLRQRFSFSNERHTRSRLVRNASYNGRLIEFACDSIVRKLEAYSVENEGKVCSMLFLVVCLCLNVYVLTFRTGMDGSFLSTSALLNPSIMRRWGLGRECNLQLRHEQWQYFSALLDISSI